MDSTDGVIAMRPIYEPGVISWPEPLEIAFQDPICLEQDWSSLGCYCPVCYPVSRDLAIFTLFEGSKSISWYVQLDQLVMRSENGCQFCSFMLVRFLDHDGLDWLISNSNSENTLFCCFQDDTPQSEKAIRAARKIREFCFEYNNPSFELVATTIDALDGKGQWSRVRFQLYSTSLAPGSVDAFNKIFGDKRQIVLEVYALQQARAASFIHARPVNIEPSSPASLERVRSWICQCTAAHSECIQKSCPPNLPTRVVQILDDGRLSLSEGLTPEPYRILSYCWGGHQSFATTTSTLASRMAGFKVSDLPKTLQDAVSLTRDLGIQYIWIDSLCILQDSQDDKERELPKMANYYKNAYLTLCAAGKTCETGFLQTFDECERHPGSGISKDLMMMPVLCPTGETSYVFFREESPYHLSYEPINQRAWTFQERILSTRMLTYGSRLMWTCEAVQSTFGGVQDWTSESPGADIRQIRKAIRVRRATGGATHPILPPLDEPNSDETSASERWYSAWYDAVEEFSNRKLTYPADKLPAIAGLASELGSSIGDRYLAGIWEGDFLRGLLWSTRPNLSPQRPQAWRAPTWSWASVQNPVYYPRLPHKHTVELATILEARVTPGSLEVAYGEIRSAVLRIRGVVVSLGPDLLEKIAGCDSCSCLSSTHHSLRHFILRQVSIYGDIPLEDSGVHQHDWKGNFRTGSIAFPLFARPRADSNVLADSDNGQRERQDVVRYMVMTDDSQQRHAILSGALYPETYEAISPYIQHARTAVSEAPELHRESTSATTVTETDARIASSMTPGPPTRIHDIPRAKVEDILAVKDQYILDGLVLSPVGFDQYERVGTFSNLLLTGIEHFKHHSQEICII